MAPSPCCRGVGDPLKYAPPRMCYPAEFGPSMSNGTRVIKEIRLKNLALVSSLSRSLKVIGTDTDRSIIYDFLLTFHSNHGYISYRFRDKRRYQSKISIFFPPTCILRPAEWVPLKLGIGAWGQKLRMMGLPGQEISLTISSAVWIQYTNVTDGRTDGQRDRRTDTSRQQIPRLRIASRGKNPSISLQ